MAIPPGGATMIDGFEHVNRPRGITAGDWHSGQPGCMLCNSLLTEGEILSKHEDSALKHNCKVMHFDKVMTLLDVFAPICTDKQKNTEESISNQWNVRTAKNFISKVCLYYKTGKWINLQVKHVKGYNNYYTNAKYNVDYKLSFRRYITKILDYIYHLWSIIYFAFILYC